MVSRGARLRVCSWSVVCLLDSSINLRWASWSSPSASIATGCPLPGCALPRCSRAHTARAASIRDSRSRWISEGRGEPTSVCCRSAAAITGCCRRSRIRSRTSPGCIPSGSGGVPNGGVFGVAALGVLMPSIGSKRALPAWLGGRCGRICCVGGRTCGGDPDGGRSTCG